MKREEELRDHFAGHIISGIFASQFFGEHAGKTYRTDGEMLSRLAERAYQTADAMLSAREGGDAHPDDIAVDRFAAAMKAKLAEKRAQGYGGWDDPEDCTIGWLSELLRKHVDKGDPVDVGNFAMMIHQRGGIIE
jgi:hypothetical protein